MMGCYGIGVSRVMGTVAELLSDEHGLVWPEAIAPAKVYLVRIGVNEQVVKAADELYEELKKRNIETLYDDRDLSPGGKFADADLLGIPYRIVVSDTTLEKGKYELKKRVQKNTDLLDKGDILGTLVHTKNNLL